MASSNIVAMLVAIYFYKRSKFKSLILDPEKNIINQNIKIGVEKEFKKNKN
jgi:hypothetical protein